MAKRASTGTKRGKRDQESSTPEPWKPWEPPANAERAIANCMVWDPPKERVQSYLIRKQIRCIERELALRRAVYPNQVANGQMTQEKADDELQTMKGVLETLEALLYPGLSILR